MSSDRDHSDRPVDAGPTLSLTTSRERDADVLAVAGEIDLATSTQLADELGRHLEKRPAVLVVDLTTVTFLDSSGLAVLVQAHEDAPPHTVLRVVADHEPVLRLMKITALDEVLAVYPTVAEAVAATGTA